MATAKKERLEEGDRGSHGPKNSPRGRISKTLLALAIAAAAAAAAAVSCHEFIKY
jgi:hypothetical protein